MKTLKKLLFAALATIGFLFAAEAADGDQVNLIENGTFDEITDSTLIKPQKSLAGLAGTWKYSYTGTAYEYRHVGPFTNESGKRNWSWAPAAYAGTYSCGFSGYTKDILSCDVDVPKTAEYVFSYAARRYRNSSGSDANFKVYLEDKATKKQIDLDTCSQNWSSGWKLHEVHAQIPAGSYTLAFYLTKNSYNAIDNVSLTEYIAPEEPVTIYYNPDIVDYTATTNGVAIGETVLAGSVVDVVATPKEGYKYTTVPEGWLEGADGVITNFFVVKEEALEITIPDPVEDADAKITFVDSEFATYSAKIGDDPIESGASVALGSLVDIVVTPNDGYRYLAIPEGWEEGEAEGTIKMAVEILKKAIEIAIPDPVASRQVLVTANDTVDYEVLTNEVKIDSGDYVLVGEVVRVEVTPKTGYWWTEVPEGWQGEVGMGTIMKTFEVVANENLEIELPTAVEHLVMVTVVNPLEKATYQLTISGEPIENGAKVLYGMVVTVTVTSTDPDYEYSKAPTGWTGGGATITREITIDDDTEDIVIPDTNFGKRQIAVNFVAQGVTYVATNLTTNTQLKNGGKADFDAQIRIVAAPYSGEYVFDKELPEGWSFGENGAIVGEVVAASSIEIPTATWTPTDGELIENGGFEYLDASEYSCAKGFPASLAGSWGGYHYGAMIQSDCYGLWKKGGSVYDNWTVWGSPHGGTYAAGANADGASSAYITVTFTTPSQSRLSSEYKFSFYAKAWRDTDSKRLASIKVLLKKGTSTKQTLEGGSLNGSWKLFEYTLTNLEKDTEYTLQFLPNEAQRSFAIDDVSLKLVQKKGLAIMFY